MKVRINCLIKLTSYTVVLYNVEAVKGPFSALPPQNTGPVIFGNKVPEHACDCDSPATNHQRDGMKVSLYALLMPSREGVLKNTNLKSFT